MEKIQPLCRLSKLLSMKQIYVRQTFLIDSCYKNEGKRQAELKIWQVHTQESGRLLFTNTGSTLPIPFLGMLPSPTLQ